MILVDTHCHLQMKSFKKDIEKVVDNARKAGVKAIINVGFDVRSSEKAVELSEKFPCMYAAVGVHPHDAKTYDANTLKLMEEFLRECKVVAIGEIGLDYFRDLSPRDVQKQIFTEQLEFALEKRVPVILHIRDAYEEVLSVLEERTPEKAILHCFSGTAADAKRALRLGLFISFGGSITYGGKQMSNTVRAVPLASMMVETDAPFLSPQPKRGDRNEPAFIRHTAVRLAEIKEEKVETVARITTENASSFFGVKVNG
jgi:TatD DNase family protein